MKTNRKLEDIRANTVNDCFYCVKDSKDFEKEEIKHVSDD